MIADESAFREYLSKLSTQQYVALDTEANSLHCYFEKLCLIQSGWGEEMENGLAGECSLIDPLSEIPLSHFFTALKGKQIIFHDADYDLRLLRRSGDFPDTDIFDTMLAAKICGEPQLGLAGLVKKYFGIILSKASRKENWSQRPLSDKMIEYAINDVRYLPKLANILQDQLEQLNRIDWYHQSRNRMVQGTRAPRQRDEENLWRIAGSSTLSQRGLAILRALWHWRDREARLLDRPAFHILSNDNLLLLAEESSQGKRFYRPHFPSARATKFEEILDTALHLQPSEWPQIIRPTRLRVTKQQLIRFNELKNHRDKIAKELALDPSILASKGALEAIAADLHDVPLMKWQREILHLPQHD